MTRAALIGLILSLLLIMILFFAGGFLVGVSMSPHPTSPKEVSTENSEPSISLSQNFHKDHNPASMQSDQEQSKKGEQMVPTSTSKSASVARQTAQDEIDHKKHSLETDVQMKEQQKVLGKVTSVAPGALLPAMRIMHEVDQHKKIENNQPPLETVPLQKRTMISQPLSSTPKPALTFSSRYENLSTTEADLNGTPQWSKKIEDDKSLYTLQVDIFHSKKEAEVIGRRLQKHGYRPYIRIQYQQNGKIAGYILRAGNFANLEIAEKTLLSFRQAGYKKIKLIRLRQL